PGDATNDDVTCVAVLCTRAFIEVGCPEGVLGVQRYCKWQHPRTDLAWMCAAACAADNRYEAALACLHQYLTEAPVHCPALGPYCTNTESTPPAPFLIYWLNFDLLSSKLYAAAEPSLKEFIVHLIGECYSRLTSYDLLSSWASMQDMYFNSDIISPFASKESSGQVPSLYDNKNWITYVSSLSEFDSGNLDGMHRILSEGNNSLTGKFTELLSGTRPDVRWRQVTDLQVGALRCAVMLRRGCSQELGAELEECEKQAQFVLQMSSCGAQTPALQLQISATLQLLRQVRGCYKGTPLPATFYAELPERSFLHSLPSDLLPTLLRHLRLLSPANPHIRESLVIPLMELSSMKQSRLQRNYGTCLSTVLRTLQPDQPSVWCQEYSHDLLDHCLQDTTAAALSSRYYPYHVSLIRQGVKLMRQAGSDLHLSNTVYIDASYNTLATLVHTCSAELLDSPKPDSDMSLLTARSILNLARWMETDVPVSEDVVGLRPWGVALHNMCLRGELYLSPPLSELAAAASHSGASCRDLLVARCLTMASHVQPALAKSWYRLANWCYRFGRTAVDGVLSSLVPLLSVEDVAGVETLLASRLGAVPSPGLVGLVCEAVSWLPSSDELKSSLETEDLCDLRLEETRASDQHLESKIATCLGALLPIEGQEREWLLRDLRALRTIALHRHYHLLTIAAHSYFQFFRTASVNNRKHDAPLMTAALRLVRLLVKHAPQLKHVLMEGFVESPTAPWTSIIPQLFARLNHSEGWVRQSISSLLCRVAEHQPHLIVIPAVVGANTHSVTTNMTDMLADLLHGGDKDDGAGMKAQGLLVDDDLGLLDDGEADEYEEGDGAETRQMLLNSCSCLVSELRRGGIPGITDAEVLVRELRRITVLWDELWLGSLQQHQADIANKFAQLSEETDKLNANYSLSAEEKQQLIKTKFEVIFKPVLLLLEQLWQFTGGSAETPHERQFQQLYGGLIRDALAALRDHASSPSARTACTLLHRLYQALQERRSNRANSSLQMAAISPTLSQLVATDIPMPGVVTHNSQMVHLYSIDEDVTILLSKTKPKKLCFRGDDGKTYRYLFKGLEDLHLDERIMQFLEMVNTLLGARGSSRLYRAQHYSVVPLGQRSGLIQWVESAVPLFGLYGRHQQREAQAVAHRTGAPLQPVRRPSELYYQKLTPRLKVAGVSLNSRKLWPKELLKATMLELVEETPSDLLSRELIVSSPTTADWWRVTHRHGVCTAVMSMVGLVLGLGDRHLDNLLVNFSTGEVVHIDYNVCFEKGKLLRVPEHVPYRMTQNIEAALGVTGVEGVFRHACEHVLATMREGRESLLTLLETFIYDPLVDWTHDADAGYAGAMYGGNAALASSVRQRRRQVERTLTLTMFRVRSKEIAAAWLANRDAVVSQLSEACEGLRALLQLQRSQSNEDAVDGAAEGPASPGSSPSDLGDDNMVISPEEAAAVTSITEQVQRLKQLFAAHHRIISDVKDLLRSLMKLKDNTGKTVRSFISRYRSFAENVTSFIKDVLSGGLRKRSRYLTHLAESSLAVTSSLYNELLALVEEDSSDRTSQESEPHKAKTASAKSSAGVPVDVDTLAASPDPDAQQTFHNASDRRKLVHIVSNTGSGVQHNPYAVAVWRRVSLKLEGRTAGQTDTARVLSIAEQ
ncbi:Serine/threonine-protein kinase SMG1, partial [Trinorchestia longiramus]